MDFTKTLSFFGKSDVGLKREYNEDSFATRPDLHLCMAADGMGGAAAGEHASRIFVESVCKVFETGEDYSENGALQTLKKAFFTANTNILNHVKENPHHQGMGCTAEVLIFHDTGFAIGHVGDSRTYRFRNGALKLLTHDHSLVQEQIDKGLITEAEAKRHSMRNIVLRAIGVEPDVKLDLLRGRALPGDQFLLCSDGLSDMVGADAISKIIMTSADLSEKVERLIDMAKANGGSDNITAVMAMVN
jgi:protein phosphatase